MSELRIAAANRPAAPVTFGMVARGNVLVRVPASESTDTFVLASAKRLPRGKVAAHLSEALLNVYNALGTPKLDKALKSAVSTFHNAGFTKSPARILALAEIAKRAQATIPKNLRFHSKHFEDPIKADLLGHDIVFRHQNA